MDFVFPIFITSYIYLCLGVVEILRFKFGKNTSILHVEKLCFIVN